MANLNDISHTFENGVTVVNTTPHPLNFQDSVSGETVVIPTSVPEGERTGDFVVNAGTNEVDLGDGLVTTEFVPSEEGLERIEQIKDWASEEGKDVKIVGSVVAAQAYPMEVVGMVAAPGFERVPPQDKLMSVEKFTAFLGDNDKNDVTNDKTEEPKTVVDEIKASIQVEIGLLEEEKNKIDEIKEKIEDLNINDEIPIPEELDKAYDKLDNEINRLNDVKDGVDEVSKEMQNASPFEKEEVEEKLEIVKGCIDNVYDLDKAKEELNAIKDDLLIDREMKEDSVEEDKEVSHELNDEKYSASLISTLKEEGFDVKETWITETALVETEDGREILVEGNEEDYIVMELADIVDDEFKATVNDEGEENKVICTNLDEVVEAVNYFVGGDKEDVDNGDEKDDVKDDTTNDDYDPVE